MNLNYLLDEHVDPLYRTQILRSDPDLVVWIIGQPGTPPKGTLDPDILIWCEEHNFVLVTHNRHTMPVHLTDHLAMGRHIPGVLLLNPNLTIGQTIDALTSLARASLENEFRDCIGFLPRL